MALMRQRIPSMITGPRSYILRLTALCIIVMALSIHASAAVNIAIVSIDQEATTLRTIRGITKAISSYNIDAVFTENVLNGDPGHDRQVMANLSGLNPRLFITIGSYATSVISNEFPNYPIIFATVINPQASGFVESLKHPGGNITGAALDIPPDIQFKNFEHLVGQIKTLGVLYSSETENIIRQATVAARQLGIELMALKVDSEKEIPQAIDSLCNICDALWSVADQRIYTPQSTKHIILQTLRYQIPMMGFSMSLVEAGGLFTLDFDFKDIGRQAGESAVRVLHGATPGDIPVTTPGIIYFKYNEKTADRIKIDIPEDMLAVAKEVIK